jgi:DNA-binding PadR family transcriptional regulator
MDDEIDIPGNKLETSLTGENLMPETDLENMTKSDRKEIVLTFMARHELALPPLVIWRNLRYHHNATFSKDSVHTYLSELSDQGYVLKINPEPLGDRQLKELDEDSRKRGYYIVTEEGKSEISDT